MESEQQAEDRCAYRALMVALHALVKLDLHNGEDADWLREELDVLWKRLGGQTKAIEEEAFKVVNP